MLKLTSLRRALITLGAVLAMGSSVGAFASDVDDLKVPNRPSIGQADATEPIKISNLNLSNELVKAKFVADPDLIRFLRGTYAEACTRGLINESAKLIKDNQESKHSNEMVAAASKILEFNRIWKLTSVEMEALFGSSYIHGAYYCDCLMKELSGDDLVDPSKSLEIVDELPASTQATCERLAQEKTERYENRYGKPESPALHER